MSEFLTTKEVAALLRVKERKIYDMAAAGEIPHRRITGKLLFPKDDIEAWLGAGSQTAGRVRPAILAGSHDPLLDWAVRESGSGLAVLFDGSSSGLDHFQAGEAALCGLHIPDEEGWNIAAVTARNLQNCVLIAWAKRVQGLIVAAGREAEIGSLDDLAGRKLAVRQPGSGARALYEALTADKDLSEVTILSQPARTETDAALAVASGDADAAVGLQAAAEQYRLGFVPLIEERFDLLVDCHAYFTEPVQKLVAFCRSDACREKAAGIGGYDMADLGRIRWLSG